MQDKTTTTPGVEIPDIVCATTQQMLTDSVMLAESGRTVEKTASSSVNASSFFKASHANENTTTTSTTTPVISSYSQQVAAVSTVFQNQINSMELTTLLKWVTEGHLEEVEKLLKSNPSLALGMGTVMDLSDRTFKNITPLQYAAWALDAEMCELIIPYLGAHNTSIQLNALANEAACYSPHSASYDFTPLVTKTQTYVDKWSSWNDAEQKRYWQKEVGGEQRKCPAWLIYAWSEEGSNVAWTKKNPNRKIKREYEKHRLDWWFRENFNKGSGVGSSWSVVRGGYQMAAPRSVVNWGTKARARGGVRDDLNFVSLVGKTRRETLQRLRVNADSQLSQVTPTETTNITSKSPAPY